MFIKNVPQLDCSIIYRAFSFVYCASIFEFSRKALVYFREVWYTNIRRKNLTRDIRGLTPSVFIESKSGDDHTFDHLQTWTVWKQCEREHRKASVSDTKAPKSRKNHLKIKCATLRDVEVASSNLVTSTKKSPQAKRLGVIF